MNDIKLLAIDLAKEVFQLHGVDGRGKAVYRAQIKRAALLKTVRSIPMCTIVMEACGSANFWARKFTEIGHEAKMISPQFVRPFVKTNKNDARDAEAIAEAASRPSMRFVPIKQIWQQDIQCLHRIRARLLKHRTAICNEIRGLLGEYGVVIPLRVANIKKHLPMLLEDAAVELTMDAREFFRGLLEELAEIESRLERFDERIMGMHRKNEDCQRISKIKGVGPVTATAVVAAIGDPKAFKNGRQFAAWLGLVPRQHSSGGKNVLLGISKRGDKYIRALLVHGARAAVRTASARDDRLSKWAANKKETRGYNKASVAVANKNARIIWALLANKEREYLVA